MRWTWLLLRDGCDGLAESGRAYGEGRAVYRGTGRGGERIPEGIDANPEVNFVGVEVAERGLPSTSRHIVTLIRPSSHEGASGETGLTGQLEVVERPAMH